jgi:hypothetical protein
VFFYGGGDGRGAFGIGGEVYAARVEVGAGDIDFEDIGGIADQAGHFPVFFGGGAGNIDENGGVFCFEEGELVAEEGFDAGVLETDAVKASRRRFGDAGRGVAVTRPESQPFDAYAAEDGDIEIPVILPAEAETAARGDERVFQRDAREIDRQVGVQALSNDCHLTSEALKTGPSLQQRA